MTALAILSGLNYSLTIILPKILVNNAIIMAKNLTAIIVGIAWLISFTHTA